MIKSDQPISLYHMLIIIPLLFALYMATTTMFVMPAIPAPAPSTDVAHIHYLAKGVLQVNPVTLATRFIPYGRGIEDRRKSRGNTGDDQ